MFNFQTLYRSVKNERIKAQISTSNITKTNRIFLKSFSKSFIEFYVVYNCFCLKRLRSKLQKLRAGIFGQFWFKWAVFSILIHSKNVFRQILHSKKLP